MELKLITDMWVDEFEPTEEEQKVAREAYGLIFGLKQSLENGEFSMIYLPVDGTKITREELEKFKSLLFGLQSNARCLALK